MKNLFTELETLNPVRLDAGLIFSGTESGTMIDGFDKPSFYTPPINHDYLFHESSRDIVVWFLHKLDPLYVYGPTGCGKSSLIKQIASRLNYPVFEVTGHGRLEFADLIGHLSVKNNNMVYEYEPLALALKYGGLFLFNEIDLTSPDVAAGLNGILDGSPLCIAENGGELITPHPMFRFTATANTNAGGDQTGLYQGTLRQNIAFADRFILCELDYPVPEIEKSLLAKYFPILPETVRNKMVDYANEIRKLFMGEANGYIEVTLSTRTLVRWAELTVKYQALACQNIQPVNYALDRALGYRATKETRAMLHELSQRMFSCNTVNYTNIVEPDETDFVTQKLINPTLDKQIVLHLNKEYLSNNNNTANKFWVATLSPTGITLNWGKTSTTGHQRFIAIKDCLNNDPTKELLLRSKAKLNKGYKINHNKSIF